MVSGRRRDDDRPINRRRATRDPKHRLLVVSEGAVTEPGYIAKFQHEVRNSRVHVEVAGQHGVPVTLVEIAVRLREAARVEAKRQRDENLLWDEVWAVFDVDSHPNLDAARKMAMDNSILLAISNPNFELWALLHFQDQRAHIERDKVRSALQGHMPGYDKELDFRRLHPTYADAVKRAQELDVEAERYEDPGRNPTTGVFRLTESIRTSA